MRSVSATVGAALAVSGAAVMIHTAPAASAYNPAVNGRFTATLIGDWARTRTVYHDEAVVQSTWTLSSSCSTAQDCSGQVVSDQGWTAPMTMHDGMTWYVKRDVPNWETCDDGTSFTGHEVFYFYPANPETGENVLGSALLAGREHIAGASGACGTNAPMYIEQPFRLDRIG